MKYMIIINNSRIKRVNTYLDKTWNDKWNHFLEIKCAIEKARPAFVEIKNRRDLKLETKNKQSNIRTLTTDPSGYF